jgi:hypothetical protein
MQGKSTGKNESLEMLRALNELTKEFKKTGPLFFEVVGLMRKATSGQDAYGYLEAADKIDSASVDEKDVMLLLSTQSLASILGAISDDPSLKATFKEKFPDSQLIQGL